MTTMNTAQIAKMLQRHVIDWRRANGHVAVSTFELRQTTAAVANTIVETDMDRDQMACFIAGFLVANYTVIGNHDVFDLADYLTDIIVGVNA